MAFETIIRKVGNSLGLLVPKEEIQKKDLKEGDKIKILGLKKC